MAIVMVHISGCGGVSVKRSCLGLVGALFFWRFGFNCHWTGLSWAELELELDGTGRIHVFGARAVVLLFFFSFSFLSEVIIFGVPGSLVIFIYASARLYSWEIEAISGVFWLDSNIRLGTLEEKNVELPTFIQQSNCILSSIDSNAPQMLRRLELQLWWGQELGKAWRQDSLHPLTLTS